MHKNKSWIIYIIIILITTLISVFSFSYTSSYISIGLSVSEPTYGQVFFDIGSGFHEKDSIRFKLEETDRLIKQTISVPNKNIGSIRIDPMETEGSYIIEYLEIKNKYYREVFNGSDLRNYVTLINHSEDIVIIDNKLSGISTGKDPYLQLSDLINFEIPIFLKVFQVLLNNLVVVTLLYIVNQYVNKKNLTSLHRKLSDDRIVIRFFIYLFFVVLTLVLVMAIVSDYNSHPDEFVHVKAVEYYKYNWLPPKIGDPETLDSYSVYGHSRLNTRELYYILAGKFSNITDLITSDTVVSIRLFNVFLFALLVALFIRSNISSRVILLFLLLTPQVWYLFSYANSDAIALFWSLIISHQIVNNDSLYNKYIHEKGVFNRYTGGLLFAILITFLYFSKQNYYVFLLFVVFWEFFRLYSTSKNERKERIKKYLLITFAIILLVSSVYAIDILIYGLDKKTEMNNMREIMAKDGFKPSQSTDIDSYPGLNLKGKGVPLIDLFTKKDWHKLSFNSFVGLYGYMNIWDKDRYYLIMKVLYTVFLLYLVSIIFLYGRKNDVIFLIAGLLFLFLNIVISVYHSWTGDFQAQGRYLFAIVPIFGVIISACWDKLNKLIMIVFINLMFLLSLYSFLFTGLYNIPK